MDHGTWRVGQRPHPRPPRPAVQGAGPGRADHRRLGRAEGRSRRLSRPRGARSLVLVRIGGLRGCSAEPVSVRAQEFRASGQDAWLPHRTLRFFINSLLINNLREQRNFSFPIPFPISIWTQSHSAGLSEPTGDGWRIGLHPPDGLPAALVPLLELVPDRARLLALRCGGRRDLSASSPSWGCSLSRAERATWWPAWSGRGRPGS